MHWALVAAPDAATCEAGILAVDAGTPLAVEDGIPVTDAAISRAIGADTPTFNAYNHWACTWRCC